MTKVQLYSGGMDSWLIDKLWKPDIKLFFDIGTANSDYELERVRKRNDVIIVKLPLAQFEQKDNNYYLPLRNLHFVLYGAHYGDVICLGATGSSTHKDKNETFAELSENVINYLLSETEERRIKVVMPYRTKTKTEILAEYLKNGGDIEKCYTETFSCYNPQNGKPCMKCTSCLSKFTAFYNNGYKFSEEEKNRFIEGAFMNASVKSDSFKLATKLKYGSKTICIDFDKTITDDTPYPQTGKVRKEVPEQIKQLKEMGYRLVLYTSRVGKDFFEAKEICERYDLPFDDYIQGKEYARFYIDDKATSFTEVLDGKI